ncbi:hypothetical protein F2P81_023966 [Scophthalmus maximus]|uniref:phosphatidate phosphatase n=1 Tax=Scophthalmus maximus TaxID=52904 RepID=A0A6A4RLH5_SCOMX|nr:hypothetical protein F2P81_023966 [Scophthalmus maximus]
MNYVGQLAGQVFVQVKELYRGLNPATLSGCIDVIVVRQPDGSLHCSPFHVRFGKMGVLRSREKVVDIEINGEPVDLHMKLGDNGEAFFVQETENDQEVVPSYLATSPIMSDGAALMSSSLMGNSFGPPLQTLGSAGGNGETGGGMMMMMKKRRKRRRKARADSVRREESGDYSEDQDMFTIDISSDEGAEMENSRSSRDVLRDETTVGPTSGSYKQAGLYTRSDGEWSPIQSPGNSRPTSPKSDSELMTKPSDADNQNPAMHWAWGELPQAATPSFLAVKPNPPLVCPVSIPVSENTHFRVITHEPSSERCGPPSELSALRLLKSEESTVTEETVVTVGMESESMRMESQTVSSETHLTTVESVAARMMADMEETMPRPHGKTDSPSKSKDKRSRHLGSDGIYLDDITELEPEVAALYFPKSDGGAAVRSMSDPGLHSTSLSPQSLSSGGDSGLDSYCDHMSDLPSIAISLCGGLTDNREITKEQFHAKIISYQQFVENPSIIDDPNLVIKIGSKYYNWSTAAPLMLAMQAFQKPLPKDSMSECGACGSTELAGEMTSRHKEESSSSDEDHRAASQTSPAVQSEAGLATGGVSYKKTLRLTSEQLLQDGPNDAVFSVTTQYQGTCRCQGTIYLWNWDDKIIISDIDGTITRNGYKFLYCSARAIGMADMTRGYLHWVNERGTMLPVGPDVFSYKEVGVPLNRIFTVNPKGELVQEHAKTNISSYARLGEVVDHVFPLKMRASTSDFPCADTFSRFTHLKRNPYFLQHHGQYEVINLLSNSVGGYYRTKGLHITIREREESPEPGDTIGPGPGTPLRRLQGVREQDSVRGTRAERKRTEPPAPAGSVFVRGKNDAHGKRRHRASGRAGPEHDEEFVDILEERRRSSDLGHALRTFNPHPYRGAPPCSTADLNKAVLESQYLRYVAKEIAMETGSSSEDVREEARGILEEMSQNLQLRFIRLMGYTLTKLQQAIQEAPVILMPNHRSYVDFLVISYILFTYDIPVPVIAAGIRKYLFWIQTLYHLCLIQAYIPTFPSIYFSISASLHRKALAGMKMVGEILRRSGAFFIRRAIGSDKLYWAVLSEYVKTIVRKGYAPMEFYVEGLRSRTLKSVTPKLGMMHMVLEPYFKSEVFDITLVPVSISYDRVLEESLLAHELLGVPKPKESTAGLLKAGKVLQEDYGTMHVNFGRPLSVRQLCQGKINRCQYNSAPRDLPQKPTEEAQACVSWLAHLMVRIQDEGSVISPWSLMACLLLQAPMAVLAEEGLPWERLAERTLWLRRLALDCGAGLNWPGQTPDSDVMSSAVALHRSVVYRRAGRVYLLQQEEPARKRPISPEEAVMRIATAVLMLASYRNQSLHVFARPALLATALHITKSTQRDELFACFCFLQDVFSYEFILVPGELSQDFEEACVLLEKCGAVHISQQEVTLSDMGLEALSFLRALIQPFIDSYQVMFRYLSEEGDPVLTEKQLVPAVRNRATKLILSGELRTYEALSSDTLKNALSALQRLEAVTKLRTPEQNEYKVNSAAVGRIGDILSGTIPPQMLQTTPDARL